MGFCYPCIYIYIGHAEVYSREKRRFGGAFGRGDTGTWIMYVKSPRERVGKKPGHRRRAHNKRDVYPRLFPHAIYVHRITVCWWKAKMFLLFFFCFFTGPVRLLYLGRSINYLLTPCPEKKLISSFFFSSADPAKSYVKLEDIVKSKLALPRTLKDGLVKNNSFATTDQNIKNK